MSTTKKSLLILIGLITATTMSLAAMQSMEKEGKNTASSNSPVKDENIIVSAQVVQNRVLKGGDGKATVAVSLAAAQPMGTDTGSDQDVDLVVVLDRSGSMEGKKLNDARHAVIALMDQLKAEDRFSIITYSNGVEVLSPLVPMNESNHEHLAVTIQKVIASGGTNLGDGMVRGIELLANLAGHDRQRKMILISDGLANRGIIEPRDLGRLASAAVENQFSISTVGVGLEFNENLMTAIADQGAGNYIFLEEPDALAHAFTSEYQTARHVVASQLKISIPMASGVRLIDAGGYPIHTENGIASIHPGNLLSGKERKLYLTFQVPTKNTGQIELGKFHTHYRYQNRLYSLQTPQSLYVSCVSDPDCVWTGLAKKSWEDQVVREEFGQLKEAVAEDIRNGDKTGAQQRIEAYVARQKAINSIVESEKVAENITAGTNDLSRQVHETFMGTPAAVAEKKKRVSKSMQYDGYKSRRDNL